MFWGLFIFTPFEGVQRNRGKDKSCIKIYREDIKKT